MTAAPHRERPGLVAAFLAGALLLAALLLSNCGGGGGAVTTPSRVADTAAADAADWAQPGDDVLEYFVPPDGLATVPYLGAPGWTTTGIFFAEPPRITMCGAGTCAVSSSGAYARTDFRADGEYLWLVTDAYYYSGAWGTTAGIRWAARDWREYSSPSRALWSWCGPRGDCTPCGHEDTQECRRENGYALLTPCGGGAPTPIRARTWTEDRGVVEWGGTVGRRHTIAIHYETDQAGATNTEIMVLARGAGLMQWEDWQRPEISWKKSSDYYFVDARTLGYRVEESHRICGWS